MSRLTVHVAGLPAPQGSKRHVGNGVMVESSKRVKPWRQDVKYAALTALDGTAPMFDRGTPVHVVITFFLPRPAGHYRTGANAHLLRDAAPAYPATKPDLDKLLRSTLDALGEAGCWHDDSQVVDVGMGKRYADGRPAGARITIEVSP